MRTKICAIIPARMASTRLPNKPLKLIGGKPMIEWVYKRVKQCEALSEVYVATDHQDIFNCVESFGGKAIMTSENCATGTDRLIEAIEQLEHFDVIVNVQGDEPLIETDLINDAVNHFLNSDSDMGTIASSNITINEYKNPNNVKVVTDKNDRALYFSRAQIPFHRDSGDKVPSNCLLHIGLYLYKYEFLKNYGDLAHSELEHCEKLEQLRVLENGYSISVAKTNTRSIGVDTPEDLKDVEKIIKEKNIIIY